MLVKKSFFSYLKNQLLYFFFNHVIAHIPCLFLRMLMLRLFGAKIGKKSIIDMGFYVMNPSGLVIGCHCHINRGVMLDARGGLQIGNNVSVSHNVTFCSGSHDYNSPQFEYSPGRIIVGDNVWIGINSTVLKNVKLGNGAVIAAGGVVTKDVPPFEVWGGVPAKKIGERKIDSIEYDCTRSVYKGVFRKPYFC